MKSSKIIIYFLRFFFQFLFFFNFLFTIPQTIPASSSPSFEEWPTLVYLQGSNLQEICKFNVQSISIQFCEISVPQWAACGYLVKNIKISWLAYACHINPIWSQNVVNELVKCKKFVCLSFFQNLLTELNFTFGCE